jgi:5'-3' exonuclease
MIKESIPFKVIKYNRSEADDVIGILARYIQNEVIVVSNDSDYLQLCDTKKIKVWNPTDKEFSKLSMTREDFLISLILKGQKKDDILNCITPSDYPIELRKPPFGDVKVQKILKEGLDKFLNTEIEIKKELEGLDEEGNKKKYEVKFKPINNYRRNEILIDFNKIPDIISSGIKNTYDEYQLPNPEGIYNFFKKNEWNGFLDNYNVVEQRLLNLYGEN